MFSYEQRKHAVDLYIKYGFKATTVARELGYPKDRRTVVKWYIEFKTNGDLKEQSHRTSKFTQEQVEYAIKHFLEHGKNYTVTIKAIGYPSRNTLKSWILEQHPELIVTRSCNYHAVNYTNQEKQKAAIELLTRETPANVIAEKYGVTRYTLYNWKWKHIDKDTVRFMSKRNSPECDSQLVKELRLEVENLKKEANELSKEVYKLQIEKDILEKATEIIKKEQGINLNNLTNREKAMVIDALKKQYPLNVLLDYLNMAKSSYFYQEHAINTPDKYSELRTQIKMHFDKSNETYGYRRINSEIKKQGIFVSEKVVRRLMQEDSLVARRSKKRHYSSYAGEITPAVPNIINRDFHSAKPNEKWLTDITEFSIQSGKVYLSPIIDCFDGMPVSWSIGTSPNADLANSMLDAAIATLKDSEKPILHSDRGCHYRWPG